MVDVEISSDSSLEKCDETVTCVRRPRNCGKPVELNFGLGEYSKETYVLYQRCADYVRLYYVRYQQKKIPLKMIHRLLELIEIYRIPLIGDKNAKKFIVRMIYPDFRNLLMFLKELDQYESKLGCHLWDLYYISSADLFASCERSSKHFTSRVIMVVRKVFYAVRKRQWEKAVLVIGNIRLVCSKLSQERKYLGKYLTAFSFYFPSLYYVVLQRHLECGYLPEVISEHYSQALASFMSTCVLKNQAYNYTEFYLTQFIVFHLAHRLLDNIDVVQEYNLSHQDPEWSRVRQIYRYWVDYEKWQDELRTDPMTRLTPTLSSFFSSMVDSVLRTTRAPLDCVGVLPVLIHLAMDVISASSMASYDFVIDIVEQQSLDPASHGTFEDLLALNLRLLFNFMDHGRNRANARAWGLLKANFLYIGTEVEAFLKPLWHDRRDWWPTFHNVTLEKKVRKVRKSVFAVLKALR